MAGTWAHLAVTFDGKNQVLLYINSILRRRIITNSTLPFSRQVRFVLMSLWRFPFTFPLILPQLLMGRLPRARSSTSSIITDEMWMMPWALKPEVCCCGHVFTLKINW